MYVFTHLTNNPKGKCRKITENHENTLHTLPSRQRFNWTDAIVVEQLRVSSQIRFAKIRTMGQQYEIVDWLFVWACRGTSVEFALRENVRPVAANGTSHLFAFEISLISAPRRQRRRRLRHRHLQRYRQRQRSDNIEGDDAGNVYKQHTNTYSNDTSTMIQ